MATATVRLSRLPVLFFFTRLYFNSDSLFFFFFVQVHPGKSTFLMAARKTRSRWTNLAHLTPLAPMMTSFV